MKRKPDENEYRFDQVPEQERENCLIWEYDREFSFAVGEQPRNPWLEERPGGEACQSLPARWPRQLFLKCKEAEAVNWANTAELKSIYSTDPNISFPCKVVKLPPVFVRWSLSDAVILDGFKKLISTWLKEQRQKDPSARSFRGKPRRGRPKNDPLKLLVDLAVYRLHRADLDADAIYQELKPFEQLPDVDPTLVKGKVFQGNLSHTCNRVEEFLFGPE